MKILAGLKLSRKKPMQEPAKRCGQQSGSSRLMQAEKLTDSKAISCNGS